VAFVLILLGFLLQWPTLLTLIVFPILLVMYARLAITGEAEMRTRCGAEFDVYVARAPRFVPSIRQNASPARTVFFRKRDLEKQGQSPMQIIHIDVKDAAPNRYFVTHMFFGSP
jgi:hypothetical protein